MVVWMATFCVAWLYALNFISEADDSDAQINLVGNVRLRNKVGKE